MSYIQKTYRSDLDAWDPERVKRRSPPKISADLEQSLSGHADVLELLVMHRNGELPDYFDPCLGYTLASDDLLDDIESSPEDEALALECVGLADNGGGLRHFVDHQGVVQTLEMGEFPHYWCPDLTCWALHQVQLVAEGKASHDELIAAAKHGGYYEGLCVYLEDDD